MAATFAPRPSLVPSQQHTNVVPGSYFEDIIEVTAGTTDYTAGGYLFGNAQLQTMYGGAYSTLVSVDVVDNWRTAAGGGTSTFIAVYDRVNQKIQAYGMNAAAGVSNALTEVANGTANMNALVCSIRIRFF
jgi:hypothetical protein